MDFLNNINDNNLNLTNINNNNDNKINQNNNQNLINSQNNVDHFKELIQEQSESDLSNVNSYNNILTNKINTNHKIQQKNLLKKEPTMKCMKNLCLSKLNHLIILIQIKK